MSDISIISTLRVAGTSNHAIAEQSEVRGGWHVFADIAERDALPQTRMVLGMPCTVIDAGGAVTKKYDLTSLSPVVWTEQVGGGGGSSGTPDESTGLLTGGQLTVNADPTKFDVSAGTGVVNGVAVSWAAKTAQTVTNIATSTVTHVFVDVAGNLVQTTSPPTPPQRRAAIYLGQLGHSNLTTIGAALPAPDVQTEIGAQLHDLLRFFGTIAGAGQHLVTANGATVQLVVGAGDLHAAGVGQFVEADSPNIVSLPLVTAPQLRRRTQTGLGSTSTSLDPDNYDLAGAITPLANNKFTTQRVFRLTGGNIVVQYGQHVYDSLIEAANAIASESFVLVENVQSNAALIAFIVMRKGTTSLLAANDARIYQAGITTAAGGSSSGITQLTGDVTAGPGSGSVVTTIADGAVTDAKVAAANKDGAAGTPSMRTLGTNPQQAAAGSHAAQHVDGVDRVSFFDLMRMERVGGYQGVSNQNITLNPFGAPAWNESGGTQRNTANTNKVTALQRRGYVSAATAGAAAGGRSQAILLRDPDGFRSSFAFAVTDAAPVAGARMFVGLRAATTAATDVQIDSVINAIGVGHESGEGYAVFHNDAAGVATKVPLDPLKFPTANLGTDIIRVEITTQKAAGTVRVTVTNVTLGVSESVLLSTDLPALSVGLTPTAWRSNGATALAVAIDVFRILFDLGGGEA